MPKQMDYQRLKCIVECLLFVASEPISEKRLGEISGGDIPSIGKILDELVQEYQHRGFQPRRLAGGWQFSSIAEYAPYIEKLYRPKVQQLSRASLETLAIIAYKQPITRAEIAAIRQVDVDGIVSSLLEKGLVQEVGRRIGPGRALLYGTTEQFLTFFGLNSLADLPAAGSLDTITPPSQQQETLFPANAPPMLEIVPPLEEE